MKQTITKRHSKKIIICIKYFFGSGPDQENFSDPDPVNTKFSDSDPG
jgi:hypothetical protein